MEDRELKILADRLIPVPKEIHFQDGADYPIASQCKVSLVVSETAGIDDKVRELFRAFWGVQPQIVQGTRKYPSTFSVPRLTSAS